jgi:Peptidase family M28/PA domain
MKLRTVFCGAIVAFSMSATAADSLSAVPAAERVGFKAISTRNLTANLYFLSSDATLGRMSLQPGDDAAAQWVAAEFAKAGLAPAVPQPQGAGTYLQAVPLIEYRPNRDANFLSLQRAGASKRWKAPELVGGYHDDVEVSAPVAFVGYGITVPALGYDDYRGIDVRGKVVLMFEHEPQENDPHSRFNGTGNTRYATNRVKALIAQAHGAAAVLVIGEPNRRHPSNLDRVARIGGSTTRNPPVPSQMIVGDEVHIPVMTLSDGLGLELLAPLKETPAMLQSAIDADLSNHSAALADTVVTLHLENKSRTTGETYNVAGLLPGSDPTLSPETVIISAHHDHDGSVPNAAGGNDIWHGADDNGSGTVGVVELAHAFAANPTRPKRSILFVVFAAEERGLLGAYYMAAHPLRPLVTTRAMINFDMIGRDETASEQTNGLIEIPAVTSNRLNLIGGAYSPDFKSTVVAANHAVGLDLDERFDHENALNVFFRSDQFPFVLHDVPAFWFFTGFHPDYHHVTDTADKIDYVKMTKIVQLSYLSAWRFASDTGHPTFVADPPGS